MPIIFKAETKESIYKLLVGWIQQSAAESKIPPQLSVPHTRLPAHSPSLSQSPPPNSQGCEAVQHDHVFVVQSQADVLEIVVVEIKDGSEIKRKYPYQVIIYHWFI